jgi:hypothetical protein
MARARLARVQPHIPGKYSPGAKGGALRTVAWPYPLPRARYLRTVVPGCPRTRVPTCHWQVPEQIHWDYGVPNGLCKETAPNSGVFTRDWTKATVSLDCNTWTPTIKLK